MDQQQPRGRSTKFSELIWAIVYLRRWLKHIRHDDGMRRIRLMGATRSSSLLRRIISKSDKEIVVLRTGNHSTITTKKEFHHSINEDTSEQAVLQQYHDKRGRIASKKAENIITTKGNPHEKVERHFFDKKDNLAVRLSRTLRADGNEEYLKDINRLTATAPLGNDISALFRKNIRVAQFDPTRAGDHEYVSEHVNYLPGTVIYFSSSVSLQSSQGQFLNFKTFPDVSADSASIGVHERFLLTNPDNLYDLSAVRFGDSIVLRSGDHEALGTVFRGVGSRSLHPSILNCHLREDVPSARWIILNRADPQGTFGKVVVNHDNIMLEQEWSLLCSSASQGVRLFTPKTMSVKDCYSTGDEATWKMYVIGLPNDNSAEMKHRVKVLQNATKQILKTKKVVEVKGQILAEKLQNKLPKGLHLDNFIVSKLDYKLYPNLDRANKMRIFHMFSRRDFKSTSSDIVGQIYGFDSNIFKYTQEMLEMRLSKDVHENTPIDAVDGSRKVKVSSMDYLRQRIADAEEAYWDNAQELLVDGKAWLELHAMDRYISRQKQNEEEEAFSFARELVRLDVQCRARVQQEEDMIRRLQISGPSKGAPNIEDDDRGGLTADIDTGAGEAPAGGLSSGGLPELRAAINSSALSPSGSRSPLNSRMARPRSAKPGQANWETATATATAADAPRTFSRDRFVNYFHLEEHMMPVPDPTKRPYSASAMQTTSSAAFSDFARNKLATACTESDFFRGMTTTGGAIRVKSAPSNRLVDTEAFEKKVNKLFESTTGTLLLPSQKSRVGYDVEGLRRTEDRKHGLPNRAVVDARESTMRLSAKNCLRFLDIVMPNKFSEVRARRKNSKEKRPR